MSTGKFSFSHVCQSSLGYQLSIVVRHKPNGQKSVGGWLLTEAMSNIVYGKFKKSTNLLTHPRTIKNIDVLLRTTSTWKYHLFFGNNLSSTTAWYISILWITAWVNWGNGVKYKGEIFWLDHLQNLRLMNYEQFQLDYWKWVGGGWCGPVLVFM